MAEFDELAASYDNLVQDPICDRFAAGTRFFHERKLDLIRTFFASRGISRAGLTWIDVGCGRGDLLRLGAGEFGRVQGCDVSTGMLKDCGALDVRLQQDPRVLPFPDNSADFVTAVCVYHHVIPNARAALTAEAARILRPGGTFAIIEHNPWNPATRVIVARSPIDTDAILLSATETTALMKGAGLRIERRTFFLYVPEKLYRSAPWIEGLAARLPLGGQYAVFGHK
jgi:ubiquinone/menaquinone biosynthesis C-methylase UbiE